MQYKELKLFLEKLCYDIKKIPIKVILLFIPVHRLRVVIRDFLFGFNIFALTDPYKWHHIKRNEMVPSGKKWLDLKNKFDGKRCFIIGSAPSVKSLNLSFLNDEYTFTCNKGFLLKNFGLKHSNFYCVSDAAFYKEFKENIDCSFADYFFISNKIAWNLKTENLYVFETSGILMKNGYFQTDMQKPLPCGNTVVIKMLQIAYYLGFKEIYLLGVDLDYKPDSSYFYNPTQKEKMRTPDEESLQNQLLGIAYASKFLEEHSVKIFNASPVGIVDCMPRVKYENLFDNKN